MRRVLVVGCHCDDIELGCGGTLHQMRDEWDITALILSKTGPGGKFGDGLEKACRSAMAVLKVPNVVFGDLPTQDFHTHRHELHRTLRGVGSFDMVLVQEADEHQDHTSTYAESLRVFRGDVTLYAYPSPYSCPHPPQQTTYSILSREDVEAKLTALANYAMYFDRPYMNRDLIEAKCRVTAGRFSHSYAESFRLIQSLRF